MELILAAFKRQGKERRIELESERLSAETIDGTRKTEKTLVFRLDVNDKLQRKVGSHDLRRVEA